MTTRLKKTKRYARRDRVRSLLDAVSDWFAHAVDSGSVASQSLDLLSLEDRVLFNAAPMGDALPDAVDMVNEQIDDVVHMIDMAVHAQTVDADVASWIDEALTPADADTDALDEDAGDDADTDDDLPVLDAASSDQILTDATYEIVFVDEGVEDYEAFVHDIQQRSSDNTRFEVITISSDESGIARISAALSEREGVDAIHFVSHGSAGRVGLGSDWLTADNLNQYAWQIDEWRFSLSEDADMLFYGCDLASTASGRALIESLAASCDCDVAASNDDTGHAIFGADWELEFAIGDIETDIAFSAHLRETWGHLLDVTIDATTMDTTPKESPSDSFAHTTSGTDRLMLVGISFGEDRGDSVTSVTYNGVPLSLVGARDNGDPTKARVEIWSLLAPDVGTHNVVVNFSGTNHQGATTGVMTFTEVNQTVPLGSFAAAQGLSATPSTTIVSASNDLVFGVAAFNDGNDLDFMPGAGQTERWDLHSEKANGTGTTELGAPTVVTSWTLGNSKEWVAGGVSIKPNTSTIVLFQEGVGGYSGTSDTFIEASLPDNSNAADTTIFVQGAGTVNQALIGFDNLFGSGPGQIPFGTIISSAELTVNVTESTSSSASVTLHRMLAAWNDIDSWNDRVAGIQFDDAEAASTADDTLVYPSETGPQVFTNLTATLQAWSDGSPNYGWAIQHNRNNDWGFSSAEHVTPSLRPRLTVEYQAVIPVISNLAGDTLAYTEGDPAKVIEQGTDVIVTDGDSPDFDTGNLRVSVFAGGDATEDVLSIRNQGAGAGNISIVGSNVFYDFGGGPLLIGTFSGGSGGADLVVTFNANANAVASDALIENVTYQNSNTVDPTTTPRIVRYILDDGDGNVSSARDATVNVTAVNDDPTNTGGIPTNLVVEQETGTDIDLSSINLADVDANGSDLTVTLSTATGGTLSALNGGGITVGGSGTGIMTLTGALADLNAYLDDPTKIQYTGPLGIDGNDADMITVEVSDNGNTGVGGGGNINLGTINVDIAAPEVLWFSTDGAANDNDAPVASWTAADIVSFNQPNMTLGTTTDGTITIEHALTDNIRALHYVTNAITVQTGGGPVYNLLPGQIVMSFRNPVALPTAGPPLNVTNADVVVYTPWLGTYEMLLDDKIQKPDATLGNIHAITIVEKQTTIGVDTVLNPGTFLVARSDAGGTHANVYTYIGSTALETPQLLLNGLDLQFGLTAAHQIQGLELLEDAVTVGGQSLASGTLLISVNTIATLNLAVVVDPQDIAALTILATEQDTVPDTNITASIFFDGSDVGLAGVSEAINAITLIKSTTDGNISPTITSDGGGATASVNVVENTTPVTTVTSIDIEAPPQVLTYSIIGGVDAAKFTINGVTGVLSFIAAPDFELPTDVGMNNVYDVTVQVSDGNGGFDTQTISVTIDPVNDNTPVFTSSNMQSIDENLTIVHKLTATDADLPAQTITFTIAGTGADDALFAVNVSDELVFLTAADFETPLDAGMNNVYYVDVRADDGNGGMITQSITVTINPVNDNNPLITSDGGGASAAVNVAENTASVTTVIATDADLPAQMLVYSISGGVDAVKFTIDSSSGALSFVAAPDFETPTDAGTDNIYDVIVQVSDGTLTDTQAIAVTVTAVNDNNPVITSDGGGASAGVNVAENTTAVTTVTATDADLPAQTLNYSILGGADAAKFTINGVTGVLSFVAAPNFELPTDAGTNNVYDVTVQVSDGNGGFDTQTISVTIDPVNDNTPIFTSSDAQSIDENLTIVHTLTATDADSPAQMITFTVAGTGADDALFAVNGSNQLVFLTAADFESPLDAGMDNVYNVDVRADDGNGGMTTQSITVTINPLNDNSPVFTSSNTPALPENQTTAVTLTATDADLPGQAIGFAISGGADAARFTINGSNELIFLSAPDFEASADANTDNVYELQVTADDGNGGMTVQVISVTVTPVNDEQVLSTNLPLAVNEGATATIDNSRLRTTDADNTPLQLVYTVTAAPSNGTLLLAGLPTASFTQDDLDNSRLSYQHDGGETTSDSFDFNVDDGQGTVSIAAFNVNITPVNDASSLSGIEVAALTFTEGDGPVPITGNLAITDVDDSTIESATIQITGNYNIGQDKLAFVDTPAVSGSWNAATGTLTLTGSASLANYEAALRSVTYANTSITPSTATRTARFVVHDGDAPSNAVTRSIEVTSVNGVPIANNDSYNVNGGTSLAIGLPSQGVLANDSDPEGEPITAILSTGPTKGMVVLQANGTFTYTPNAGAFGVDEFIYVANDGTSTSAPARVVITIAVAGAPGDGSGSKPPARSERGDESSDESDRDASPPKNVVPPPAIGAPIGGGQPTTGGGEQLGLVPPPIDDTISTVSDEEAEQGVAILELDSNLWTSSSSDARERLRVAAQERGDEGNKGSPQTAGVTQLFGSTEFGFISRSSAMWQDLDELDELVEHDIRFEAAEKAVTFGVSTSLSVGYVLWFVRGSYLVSCVLAQMPAWKMVDPMFVFGGGDLLGDEDDESLNAMLQRSNEADHDEPSAAESTPAEEETL